MSKKESDRLKRFIDRNSKLHSLRYGNKKAKKTPITTPIDDPMLIVREMKGSDKLALHRIISEFRRDFYIAVYKATFRSWFTYGLTAILLAISLSVLRSNLYAVCSPPILVTMLLLWRVNAYKNANRHFTVNDMELVCQAETPYYKFKSNESRRTNQGVLLAFVREKRKRLEDIDLDALDESDLDKLAAEEDSDLDQQNTSDETKYDNEQNLAGYLIYGKQMDELETVAIKELCIAKDYRRRRVATCFLRKTASLLRDLNNGGYSRFTFQVSTFDHDLLQICEKKSSIVEKIYTWTAYQFLPGVYDHRNVYGLEFNKINTRL